MRTKTLGALLALVAIAGLTASAVAAGDPSRPAKAAKPAQREAAKQKRIKARAARALLVANVGLFRRERRAADVVPPALADSPLLADARVSVGTARAVGTAAPAFLLESDRGEVCKLAEGFLSCAPVAHVVEHGFAPAIFWRGSEYRVEGIAADGVKAVSVAFADGSTTRAGVAGNTIAVTSAVRPRSVSWTGPNGPEELAFPG